MKRLLIAAVIVLPLLLVVLWFYNHSFLTVAVQSAAAGEFTYTIHNQDTNKDTTIKTTDQKVHKFVARGNYEVSVQSGATGFIGVTKTQGFMQNTELRATLKGE